MKALMGMNESKKTEQSAHLTNITEAKDGNTYAIVKENSEYLIKVLVKEGKSDNISDYDYIGGLGNKRSFVFESFNGAKNQLANKVGLIAETFGSDKAVIKEAFKLPSLVTESEESACKCGGNCKCESKKEKNKKISKASQKAAADEVSFVEEEVFGGYNDKKSFTEANSRKVVELLNTISEDWGKGSKEAVAIKGFAMNNVNTDDLNASLSETQLHKLNVMLSEMGFVNYKGNAILEAAQALAEEKYKLKLDVPTEEVGAEEDELDSSEFDFGEEGADEEEEVVANDKPFDDAGFDAEVDADEDEDPKNYIQKLAGKLGQSLRDYNGSLETPDFDLEKFAINSVISATNTADMSEEDQNDIIAKVKEAGEGESNGEVSDEEGSEENFDEPSADVDADIEKDVDVDLDIEADVDGGGLAENGEMEELGDEESTEAVDDVELLGLDSDIDGIESEESEEGVDDLLDMIVARVMAELEESDIDSDDEVIESSDMISPLKKALKLK